MKKIIIIDDDPGIQDSASLIFTQVGYEVTVYRDGNAILAGEFEPPDIFVIDKQLPGVDGLDICRHLKKSSSTRDIPIIIMSASSHAHKLAIMAGAEGFIEKPYTLKEIRGLVDKHIK